MRLGTLFANMLCDLERSQAVDQPRSHRQTEDESRQSGKCRPDRDVAEYVECAQSGPIGIQGVQELIKDVVEHQTSMLEKAARSVFNACSSLTPRDPFKRMTSPFLTIRA